MKNLSWNKEGTVGIISIPQKRTNGKDRTLGFIQALDEESIKVSGFYQQVDFSYEETYNYSKKLIEENKNLRAIWLQGSDKYKGALDAIKEANKQKEIALICFDAEPEFLEMIQNGDLVGSAMQQPYMMGQEAVISLNNFLNNKYDIAIRCGTHCAPLMHQHLNTVKSGIVRVSLSFMNTKEEIQFFIKAIQEISEGNYDN